MASAMTVVRCPSLPKLAWYATWVPNTGRCEVEVGDFVEVDPDGAPRWVASGLWEDDFTRGGFDQVELCFGSGLRLDEHGLTVVPSSSATDRCITVRHGDRWHVSNSLVVMLGRLGARLSEAVDHRAWSESSAEGVLHYRREIPVVHPTLVTVSQQVVEVVRFCPDGSRVTSLRERPHHFSSYREYVTRVEGALRRLWANATDPHRRRPMVAATTTSRGYDSPAVTAFVTRVVPGAVSWTARRSNTRIPAALRRLMDVDVVDDDGSEIARRLGATPRYLDPDNTMLPAELEAWCWASAQLAPELIFHSLLEDADAKEVPTVLFAGHNGDRLWSRELEDVAPGHWMARGAASGASLIEARLATGVIEVALPFLFARSIAQVHAVTISAEMRPWTLGTAYDRPIPRRLLEERGVPRDWFGFGKKAVAQDFESPQGTALRRLFFSRSRWSRAGEALYRGANLGHFAVQRTLDFIEARGDRDRLVRSAGRDGKHALSKWTDLHRSTFVECTNLLASRFARGRGGAAPGARSAPG